MRIVVVGGNGSIGSRYVCILKILGHEVVVWDLPAALIDPIPEADKYIIATPTDTHFDWCKKLIEKNATFLCEKPLSKNPEECQKLASYTNGFMVNNYRFLPKLWHIDHTPDIYYNYFKTGKDGLLWDCCQLIALDPNAKLANNSALWRLWIDGEEIPYRDLENGYVGMIHTFLEDRCERLWDLRFAEHVTRLVIERIEKES